MTNSNEYMRDYMRIQYHERRREAYECLGGLCTVCSTENDLEIDHIDWCQKSMTIKTMFSVSRNRFLAELGKCQLLCQGHHIQKTKSDHLERLAIHGWRNQYGGGQMKPR